METISHISPSMLGLFCRCQEAFHRRYLEGEIIPPGIAAITGTGMHKAAELNFTQKITSGEDLPLSDMQDAARDGYMEACQKGVFVPKDEEASFRTDLAKGLDRSVQLTKLFAERVAPTIQPVASEQKMQALHPALPVPFLGILDVRSEHAIHDLKTSSRKWSAGKEDGQLQPPIYRYLVQENLGTTLPFSFHVVSDKDVQEIPAVTGQGDIEPIVMRAKALLLSMQTGTFLPAEPGHWMCSPKWCGYFWSCPCVPAYKKFPSAA